MEAEQAQHSGATARLASAVACKKVNMQAAGLPLYQTVFGQIVDYVCAAAGLEARAANDPDARAQVSAAVESVLQLSSLAYFLTLPAQERMQQVGEGRVLIHGQHKRQHTACMGLLSLSKQGHKMSCMLWQLRQPTESASRQETLLASCNLVCLADGGRSSHQLRHLLVQQPQRQRTLTRHPVSRHAAPAGNAPAVRRAGSSSAGRGSFGPLQQHTWAAGAGTYKSCPGSSSSCIPRQQQPGRQQQCSSAPAGCCAVLLPSCCGFEGLGCGSLRRHQVLQAAAQRAAVSAVSGVWCADSQGVARTALPDACGGFELSLCKAHQQSSKNAAGSLLCVLQAAQVTAKAPGAAVLKEQVFPMFESAGRMHMAVKGKGEGWLAELSARDASLFAATCSDACDMRHTCRRAAAATGEGPLVGGRLQRTGSSSGAPWGAECASLQNQAASAGWQQHCRQQQQQGVDGSTLGCSAQQPRRQHGFCCSRCSSSSLV